MKQGYLVFCSSPPKCFVPQAPRPFRSMTDMIKWSHFKNWESVSWMWEWKVPFLSGFLLSLRHESAAPAHTGHFRQCEGRALYAHDI